MNFYCPIGVKLVGQVYYLCCSRQRISMKWKKRSKSDEGLGLEAKDIHAEDYSAEWDDDKSTEDIIIMNYLATDLFLTSYLIKLLKKSKIQCFSNSSQLICLSIGTINWYFYC